jgi:hypothetical protein
MRFAYADPPYLGVCRRYGHRHEEPYGCWDDIATHAVLISRLADYDGWALSSGAKMLRDILTICPDDVRVAAWAKPWAVFLPNVNPAYCWEAVIFRGARRRSRADLTVRDYLVEPMTMQRGLVGAKPERFCRWVSQLLGVRDCDTLDDLFPGTGVMNKTLAQQVIL